jgi:hypothetical protein
MSLKTKALVTVLAAALTLGGSASAGTTKPAPKKVDLTNRSSVDSYLQSIGVNPATVVRQVGLKNYAGPSCPGVGWNCTTSTEAVQIAPPRGVNRFDCEGQEAPNPATDEDTNMCVVFQSGPDNRAQCKLTDTGEPVESQSCLIDQTGARNLAIVDQLIEQRTGPDQDARQLADVRQREGENNESAIHQDVKQDTKIVSMTGAQNQNIHQVALVYQQSAGSENLSRVHQNQDLSESGAATTQNQNVADLPANPPLVLTDCDPNHKDPSNPNACANISQTITSSTGGLNESTLHQNINESETTTVSPSTQRQEDYLSGIEGTIDQTNPPDVGTNRKISHQDGRQRQEGGTSQTQIMDPNCCGIGTTVGGAVNFDDFDQTAIQTASLGTAAFQRLGITGDTNHIAGGEPDFLSVADGGTNVCVITHDARNNTDSTQFTVNIDPCDSPVSLTTECFSGTAAKPGGCTDPTEGERSATAFSSSAASRQSSVLGPILSGL